MSSIITESDKTFFEEHGYWLSPPLFDHVQVERLREAHERYWQGDTDHPCFIQPKFEPGALRKGENGWWAMDAFYEAVANPVIGKICSVFMNTNIVRLWHDQILYKPSLNDIEDKSNVGWHQDYNYFQVCDTTNMITAWIALQDTDLSNGGMRFVDKSHQMGLLEGSAFFNQDLDQVKDSLGIESKDWVEVPGVLKAGAVSFHHSLTIHGSGPNVSDRPRMSIVAHYMPDGAAYKHKSPPAHYNHRFLGPRKKAGQKYDDPTFFPTVFNGN
jgi:ectoine hydroxylase-related dioxygenase (phytanoyl-CoA dioxygenase family)